MRLKTCISTLAIGALLASCGGTSSQTPNATAPAGVDSTVPTSAIVEATDTLPDQVPGDASQPTAIMPQPTTTGGTEAMPETTPAVMPEPTTSGNTQAMPESASGAPMAEITDWQTVELSDLSISLDVPANWEQSGDGMAWTPAGATAPRVGVNSAEMNADWTPSSMLPDGAQVRDTELVNLPWAQAQLYTVETSDANQELHAIVRAPNNQALNFYAVPAPGNDAKSIRPVLDHMLNSVDASGV